MNYFLCQLKIVKNKKAERPYSNIFVCLFVSRVSFCYSLTNVSIFAVFPEVVNLLCKLPGSEALTLIHFTGFLKQD